MRILALIPVRAGSKGIINKNKVEFCGKPLLWWTLAQAKRSSKITETAVLSDDPELRTLAAAEGLTTIDRPPELSDDHCQSEAVLKYGLEKLGQEFQLVVFLQATSPLRKPDDIDKSIAKLIEEDADSLFSCSHMLAPCIWQRQEDLRSISYDYKNRQMRQNFPSCFLENGSIYVFKPEILLNTNNRLGGKITNYEMENWQSLQIDEPQDLGILAQQMHAQGLVAEYDKIPKPELIVFDFDGVMTDNRVIVWEDGREGVLCHRGDGLGIRALKSLGIPILILSTETNPVVKQRAKKLGLECYHGLSKKEDFLVAWAKEQQIKLENTIFIGNDENDRACLEMVGKPMITADAWPDLRNINGVYSLQAPGGKQVSRELYNLLQN